MVLPPDFLYVIEQAGPTALYTFRDNCEQGRFLTGLYSRASAATSPQI